MSKRVQRSAVLMCLLLLGAVTVAQDPVVDIDKNLHPNLFEAQRLVVQANHFIAEAQKDNRYDMHGHAEKARQLLVDVNNELKAAAVTANRP